MKVLLINGSPKHKGSTSGLLLEDIKRFAPDTMQIAEADLHTTIIPKDFWGKWEDSDACVIAYPLYVDGIPGHLLPCLVQIEKRCHPNSVRHIYGIVNNGFYEGNQANTALQILENWCTKTGFPWGGGIGIGGGGSISSLPNGNGLKKPIEPAMQTLVEHISNGDKQKNIYVGVGMPGFLYKLAAQLGWRQTIKKNGGKPKDLGRQH